MEVEGHAVGMIQQWLTLHHDKIVISDMPGAAAASSGTATEINLDNISGVAPNFSSAVPGVFMLGRAVPPAQFAFHASDRGEATWWITSIISARHFHHFHHSMHPTGERQPGGSYPSFQHVAFYPAPCFFG